MDRPSDPLPGTRIGGRYDVIRLLGEGGMGAVYEAEHVDIGRRVAVKTLHVQFADDEHLLARFRREARTAGSIGHEHIVDVFDFGTLDDGTPYLVMEKLQGKELADLLEEVGPLPVGRAVRIMRQVLAALGAAHDAGVVHRDLKPANIFLVDRSGGSDHAKVLDFGISKILKAGDKDTGLTKTGTAMGTPAYMSPEQAQGLKTLDHRTDLYTAGIILYELLTGYCAFDGETYAALLIQVLTATPPSLSEYRSDVPDALGDVLFKTFAKQPVERFQTAAEMSAALAPFEHLSEPPQLTGAKRPSHRPASTGELQAAVAARDEAKSAARTSVARAGARAKEEEKPEQDASSSGAPQSGVPSASPGARVVPRTQALPRPSSAAPTPAPVGQTAGETGVDLPRKASKVPLLIGGGLAALVAIVLVAVFAVGPSEDVAPERSAPGEEDVVGTAPPPVVPTESTTVDEPVANAPSEVRIRMRAVPSEAKIFINDVEYPNPMDASQVRSLTPYRVRIEAEGHRTMERLVIFDSDQTLAYELATEDEPRRSRRPSPRPANPGPQPAATMTAAMETGGMGEEPSTPAMDTTMGDIRRVW